MKSTATENSIFLQRQDQECVSDQEIYYQKSSGDNQNEYLSQFLNNHGSKNLQQILSSKSEHLERPNNSIDQERQVFSMENKQNLANKKRKKSCFHNFQKHLVITLRNVIKLNKYVKIKEIETIANQMWNVFTRSTLYCKKFLYVLFGVYGNSEENDFSKNFLNELGFMEIFAKYQQVNIKDAQKYLRKQIINQLQQLNIQQYLHFRKLKRVQQFENYLEEFIEQLKDGSMRKRLPKEKKIEMFKQIKQKEGSKETSIRA